MQAKYFSKTIFVFLIINLLLITKAQAFLFFSSNNNSNQIKPQVLALAIKAYQNAKAEGVRLEKPVLTIIDYSLPSNQKRLWVLDLAENRVLFNTLVAHGKNSGEVYSTKFSNSFGSQESSIGTYVTEGTYFGHRGYTLRIKGLEKGFNDRAEPRRIVIHGAWYVSDAIARMHGGVGRSWGCPAVDEKLAAPVINTIKDGSLVFAYYPDKNWLQHSHILNYNA